MKRHKTPNVVLILCDTLGAKHMSLYGYHRKTTPHLQRMTEEDSFTVYARCFSPAPWTVPSHASLFTGLYPSEHKCDGGNFFLNEELNLLPDIIKGMGYRTFGISSNSLVSSFFGYGKGFDKFYEMWNLFNEEETEAFILRELSGIDKSRKPAVLLNHFRKGGHRAAISRVLFNMLYRRFRSVLKDSTCSTVKTMNLAEKILKEQSDSGNPFFLFVNLMQTHDKYNPPKQYRNIFVKDNPYFDRRHRREDEYFHYTVRPYEDEFLRYLEGLYDQEILFLDSMIYRFVQSLKASGSFDNTVIIITSDHGEMFGEHNHIHHLFTTYNELIHIPLIVRHLGRISASEEGKLVQLHDLYSTLLDVIDAPYPRPSSSISLYGSSERKFAVSQLINTDFKIAACKKRNASFSSERGMYRLDKSEMAIMTLKNGEAWKYVKTADGKERMHDLCKDFKENGSEVYEGHQKLMVLRDLFERLARLTGYEQI